jgi:hypothetical protein
MQRTLKVKGTQFQPLPDSGTLLFFTITHGTLEGIAALPAIKRFA